MNHRSIFPNPVPMAPFNQQLHPVSMSRPIIRYPMGPPVPPNMYMDPCHPYVPFAPRSTPIRAPWRPARASFHPMNTIRTPDIGMRNPCIPFRDPVRGLRFRFRPDSEGPPPTSIPVNESSRNSVPSRGGLVPNPVTQPGREELKMGFDSFPSGMSKSDLRYSDGMLSDWESRARDGSSGEVSAPPLASKFKKTVEIDKAHKPNSTTPIRPSRDAWSNFVSRPYPNSLDDHCGHYRRPNNWAMRSPTPPPPLPSASDFSRSQHIVKNNLDELWDNYGQSGPHFVPPNDDKPLPPAHESNRSQSAFSSTPHPRLRPVPASRPINYFYPRPVPEPTRLSGDMSSSARLPYCETSRSPTASKESSLNVTARQQMEKSDTWQSYMPVNMTTYSDANAFSPPSLYGDTCQTEHSSFPSRISDFESADLIPGYISRPEIPRIPSHGRVDKLDPNRLSNRLRPALDEAHSKISDLPIYSVNESRWHYIDMQGQIQGPYNLLTMMKWFLIGHFPRKTEMKREIDNKFSSIEDGAVFLEETQRIFTMEQQKKKKEQEAEVPIWPPVFPKPTLSSSSKRHIYDNSIQVLHQPNHPSQPTGPSIRPPSHLSMPSTHFSANSSSHVPSCVSVQQSAKPRHHHLSGHPSSDMPSSPQIPAQPRDDLMHRAPYHHGGHRGSGAFTPRHMDNRTQSKTVESRHQRHNRIHPYIDVAGEG